MSSRSCITIPGDFRAMRRRGASPLAVLVLFFFLAGCAGPHLAQIREEMTTIPLRANLKDVPLYPQEADQCGAAALAMVLNWSGLPARPAIVGAARRSGRLAYPLSGTKALLQEVAAGHPVIVLLNLGLSWYPKWHYAVVTGYDLSEGFIVLHSGKIEPEYLPFRVFQNTWARSHRWGLLVLGPGDLPGTAEETPYLAAVLGLEKARRWHEAVEGYQTALQQWPGSLPALMGLGNSLYALRDLPKAEKAFQDAARLHPDSGAAFNNLAQVLWEEGRRKEALAAAQKAVTLGGPLVPTFRKTLEEIQSGNP